MVVAVAPEIVKILGKGGIHPRPLMAFSSDTRPLFGGGKGAGSGGHEMPVSTAPAPGRIGGPRSAPRAA